MKNRPIRTILAGSVPLRGDLNIGTKRTASRPLTWGDIVKQLCRPDAIRDLDHGVREMFLASLTIWIRLPDQAGYESKEWADVLDLRGALKHCKELVKCGLATWACVQGSARWNLPMAREGLFDLGGYEIVGPGNT